MRFSHFFVDRPIFAAVISIIITLVGYISFLALPITEYPQIAPPTVVVSASYAGASAEVVAQTVAAPIEQEINGVDNMLYVVSQSTGNGAVSVTIILFLSFLLRNLYFIHFELTARGVFAVVLAPFLEDVRRLVHEQPSDADASLVGPRSHANYRTLLTLRIEHEVRCSIGLFPTQERRVGLALQVLQRCLEVFLVETQRVVGTVDEAALQPKKAPH